MGIEVTACHAYGRTLVPLRHDSAYKYVQTNIILSSLFISSEEATENGELSTTVLNTVRTTIE